MNSGDFTIWHYGAPLIQAGASSGEFLVWNDDSPVVQRAEPAEPSTGYVYSGDFTIWSDEVPIVQVGAYSGNFMAWLDGAPVVAFGSLPPGPPVNRRRVWIATYNSLTRAASYVFARFTFEPASLAGWTKGPSIEIVDQFTFEDSSLTGWTAEEWYAAFSQQQFDFEDSDLSTWVTA